MMRYRHCPYLVVIYERCDDEVRCDVWLVGLGGRKEFVDRQEFRVMNVAGFASVKIKTLAVFTVF